MDITSVIDGQSVEVTSSRMSTATSSSASNTAMTAPSAFMDWSDSQLLSAALHYGKEALHWRRKFLGTLPEIAKRKLYEQHGCSSIVEFAGKVGGVSEAQVCEILQLKEKFNEVPVLQELLVSGMVSMHKLARVASVAGPENQAFLADQVQLLSRRAVDTLVKDIQYSKIKSLSGQKLTLEHIQEITQLPIMLDRDVAAELEELKEKGIDVNDFLRTVLRKRRDEIEEEYGEIEERHEDTNKMHHTHNNTSRRKKSSRHIPIKTRQLLKKEHGTKCAITGCHKLATQIHHTKRHAIDSSHDPRYLAQLCEEHHQIAHAIDVKVQEKKRTAVIGTA